MHAHQDEREADVRTLLVAVFGSLWHCIVQAAAFAQAPPGRLGRAVRGMRFRVHSH